MKTLTKELFEKALKLGVYESENDTSSITFEYKDFSFSVSLCEKELTFIDHSSYTWVWINENEIFLTEEQKKIAENKLKEEFLDLHEDEELCPLEQYYRDLEFWAYDAIKDEIT